MCRIERIQKYYEFFFTLPQMRAIMVGAITLLPKGLTENEIDSWIGSPIIKEFGEK
jgi:hypothetical protein